MTAGNFIEVDVGVTVEQPSRTAGAPRRLAVADWVRPDDGTSAHGACERIRPAW